MGQKQFYEKLKEYTDAKAAKEGAVEVARLLDFSREDMPTLREALSTPDASIIMPRVISDVMRDAAEPMYIGAKLLQVVRLRDGRSIEFPAISAMRAFDIAEGQEIPEAEVDFNKYKTTEIRIGKSGLRIAVTDEMIDESQWDVIGILLRKAGEALARHKEEKIFQAFSDHSHPVFDNDDPVAPSTTGRAFDGTFNATLSTEDLVDMNITLMSNGMVPTDILMHPMCWAIFAKNEYISSLSMPALGAPGNNSITLNPNAVGGRLPFAMTIQFSPFIPFNRADKKFDIYVVDRNNIGILLVKNNISTERFDEPLRDIQNIKAIERYGVGILYEGEGIAVAKNVAYDKSYELPQRVVTFDKNEID